MAQPPTRRGMLSTAALSPLVALFAPSASAQPAVRVLRDFDFGPYRLPASDPADAELIAIGREAGPLADENLRLTAEFLATPSGAPELEMIADTQQPLCDRLDDLLDDACDLRAATVAGLQAKAVLLRHELRAVHGTGAAFDSDEASPEIRLAWSLCNDLLGEVT